MKETEIKINETYYVWEYTWEYKISRIKIIKETPCKFFYETLEGSKFNYSDQTFKNKLDGHIFKSREDCKESIRNAIQYKINNYQESIKKLVNLKETHKIN